MRRLEIIEGGSMMINARSNPNRVFAYWRATCARSVRNRSFTIHIGASEKGRRDVQRPLQPAPPHKPNAHVVKFEGNLNWFHRNIVADEDEANKVPHRVVF